VILWLTVFGSGPGLAHGQDPPDSLAVLMGTVRGRFLDGTRPLPNALVEIVTSRGTLSASVDAEGRYEIPGIAMGEARVRASHAGYASVALTVRMPASGEVRVDLELTATPLRLSGIEVSTDAESPPAADASDGALAAVADPDLEVRMLEISPTVGEAGMLTALQSLPGNDPADPSDVLFMRGSTTDLKLVLLDGVPVFTPFHVAGLMLSFEPTVLGRADLYVGGAPARYDGGLTHILDLTTRSARRDRVRVSGAVDLLSASVAAELPLTSKAGAIFSARGLHDLGRVPLAGERPYGYRDVLFSVEAEPTSKHSIRSTGFWNEESVRLDFDGRPSDAAWSNRAGSLSYRGRLGPALLRVTAGASHYTGDLPLQPTARPDEPPPSALLASAESDRVRLMAEGSWGSADAPFRAGLTFEDIQARFTAESLDTGAQSGNAGARSVIGAFGDVTRPLSPGLTLRAGLRSDLYSGYDVRISPRIALFWELGPEVLLSVAGGRYHQVTRTPDSQLDETVSALANQEVGPGELLPVATADHVVLSLAQRIGTSVTLGLDGFWKQYEGLHGAESPDVRNSGMDLRVLSARPDGTVWLGYGLSWFWSPVDLSGRSSDFAGRHLLSAGVSGKLGGRLRGEARVAYGAGLPSTSIPFGSAEDALSTASGPEGTSGARAADPFVPGLDESFLRIDLEVHAVFEPLWAGHSWRVRPYLRVLNALDRRDALFYTYQPWRSDAVTPLAERPFLPVLGVSFSF
jgi:hypothetical protein